MVPPIDCDKVAKQCTEMASYHVAIQLMLGKKPVYVLEYTGWLFYPNYDAAKKEAEQAKQQILIARQMGTHMMHAGQVFDGLVIVTWYEGQLIMERVI